MNVGRLISLRSAASVGAFQLSASIGTCAGKSGISSSDRGESRNTFARPGPQRSSCTFQPQGHVSARVVV